MKFMNAQAIDEAVTHYRDHPVLRLATRTLAALRDATDENSDGWCYWPKPARVAAKLMTLIEGDGTAYYRFDSRRVDATPAALLKALAPIKAFRTRTKLNFIIYE